MGRYIVGPDILPSLTPSGRNPLRYNSTGAGLLERAAGIEPASSAWKAEVIAIIRCPPALLIMTTRKKWWREKDSNLRRQSRQIYSLIPLAAREPLLIMARGETSSFAQAGAFYGIKSGGGNRGSAVFLANPR